MLKLPRFSTLQSGFTMIELLVVIAVIGVLSVAVLSSINPIEQINKGRDTRSRSDAAQLINAVDRYFSIHEVYPWNVAVTGTYTPASTDYNTAFTFDQFTPGNSTSPGTWNWIDQLATTSEVKSGFTSRLKANTTMKYYIYKGNLGNDTMYVCFRPTSYAFMTEAKKRCEGTLEADFPSTIACPSGSPSNCTTSGAATPTGANACMICLP